MHKTSAWPLALAYAALIVYASLYPFGEWHYQEGLSPWMFLFASLPKYWTGFDVAANIAGYTPFGFLLALGMLRSGRRGAVATAVLAGTSMSLCMECLQIYLPRVSSNVDLALNMVGTLAGAWVAVMLAKLGVLQRWTALRERWFVGDARGALVLLALWPLGLLFPATVPFGLGQIVERLEAALAQALEHTPFLEWLPVRDVELQPLAPGMELVCVALGLLIPCLLGFSVVRHRPQRLALAAAVVATGVAVTTLSCALTYGPIHAWEWLSFPVQVALWLAAPLVALLALAPQRVSSVLVIAVLVPHMSLLNSAPVGAYFAQTLHTWEQGRFIHFYGVTQWLGWFWPYVALVYAVMWLSRRPVEN